MGEVAFDEAPRLISNPNGRTPLSAEVVFVTAEAVRSQLSIADGTRSWQAEFNESVSGDGRYSLPVLGMRVAREHNVTLTVIGADGEPYVQVWTHTTPPLPANPLEFPELDVQVSMPDRMEPGVTFLSLRRRALGRPHWLTQIQRDFSEKWGRIVALNARGEVVWIYESDWRTAGIARLGNGNILMHRTDFSTVEIDLLGNVVRQYYAENRPFPPPENPDAIPILGQQTLHHQPHQMPNGDYLAFSANGYLIEDYYTSDNDPDAPRADQVVMADRVVQFNPAGEIVWSWDTFDALDPFRIGYDTFSSYWWVRGFDQYMDWTHANGLSYDATDDSVLISLRHQNAILKVSRETNEIKWILGRHEGWPDNLQDRLLAPVGELLWPGYQHNPRMTHAGTVVLFDNRAHGGAMPFEPRLPLPESFSRGVEYEVDESNMTVRQIWTSGDTVAEDSCFANAMSDAWRLPLTDNRLVIFAFCLPRLEGFSQDSMDHTSRVVGDLPYGGRVVEYDDDEIVFRVEAVPVFDLMQWEFYCGFRSPDVYHRPEVPTAH